MALLRALKSWFELLDVAMPGYVQEGKKLAFIAEVLHGCASIALQSPVLPQSILPARAIATLFHRDPQNQKRSPQAE